MFDFIYKLRFFFLPYIKILHLEYTIYIHNFESINFSIHIHQHFLPRFIQKLENPSSPITLYKNSYSTYNSSYITLQPSQYNLFITSRPLTYPKVTNPFSPHHPV